MPEQALELLTPRERECLRLVNQHLSSKEIGRELGISKHTVDTHLDKARQQFRVGNLYFNRSCVGALVKVQPFGGFKMSGVGTKAGGPDYLLHFMDPRCVTEQPL